MRPRMPTPLLRALRSIARRPRLLLGSFAVGLLTALSYAGASVYIASGMIAERRVSGSGTPGDHGLAYRDVTFPARGDELTIRGWFIPGVLPDGRLTSERVILVVPGKDGNRADPNLDLLGLSAAFARRGFAVLAFDMRGTGSSADARFSAGLYEQRDVLGAVDFLRRGALPYPDLGRPRAIGGWGVSLGAQSLLFAATCEPAVSAIAADSTFAEAVPVVQSMIPNPAGLRWLFEPGALLAARVVYGIDYAMIRPVDAVARFAPRHLLLIHGSQDDFASPANLSRLVSAAQTAPGASVATWLVPEAGHGMAFRIAGDEYISRVVHFFAEALS